MWTDFINWRIKIQIDQLQVPIPWTQTYYFPQLAPLRKIYPHGYHKYDKKVYQCRFSTGRSTLRGQGLLSLKKFSNWPTKTPFSNTTLWVTSTYWQPSSMRVLSRSWGRRGTQPELFRLARFSIWKTSNWVTQVLRIGLLSRLRKWRRTTILRCWESKVWVI